MSAGCSVSEDDDDDMAPKYRLDIHTGLVPMKWSWSSGFLSRRTRSDDPPKKKKKKKKKNDDEKKKKRAPPWSHTHTTRTHAHHAPHTTHA